MPGREIRAPRELLSGHKEACDVLNKSISWDTELFTPTCQTEAYVEKGKRGMEPGRLWATETPRGPFNEFRSFRDTSPPFLRFYLFIIIYFLGNHVSRWLRPLD